jgi:hypothetical protein
MHRLILWIAVAVVVLVVQRLHVFGREVADTRATPMSAPVPHAQNLLPPRAHDRPRFRCDGRIYCSQMHSRAEAEYFTRHCPGTRMDGDHDGIPCENDSRF